MIATSIALYMDLLNRLGLLKIVAIRVQSAASWLAGANALSIIKSMSYRETSEYSSDKVS